MTWHRTRIGAGHTRRLFPCAHDPERASAVVNRRVDTRHATVVCARRPTVHSTRENMKILSRRSFENGDREGAGVVRARHTLRTNSWTADVATLESAIARLTADRPLADDCQVVFFEIAGDNQLHVNVTHRRAAIAVDGWAGPARVPDGFVHNRRFAGDTTTNRMMRHIRDMVFAPPTDAN
jgi:hypothetical protein